MSVLDFFTAATARWPVCLPIPGKYRERCRRSLERVHGGSLSSLMAALYPEKELSREDIAELERILEKGGK